MSLKITKTIKIKTKGKVEFNGVGVAISLNSNKIEIDGLNIYNYDSYGIIINSNNDKIFKNTISNCVGGSQF